MFASLRNNNNATRNAKPRRYTWIASINFNSRVTSPIGLKFGEQFCQGTLVSSNIVLTAASCFYTIDKQLVAGRLFPQVRVGAYAGGGRGDGFLVNATALAYHRLYNWRDGLPSYDIALLRLARSVPGVRPVRLEKYSNFTRVKNNTMLSIVGWGPTQARGPMAPSLMWTNILMSDKRTCQREWPGRAWDSGRLVCARFYGHGKNTCYNVGYPGDGGAPLFLEGRTASQDVQVGIVNQGRCNRLKPSIFQSVSHFRPWISQGIAILQGRKQYTGADPYFIFVKSQRPSGVRFA